MLNSKARMARAMSHQPVDRVPVMCQLSLGHYFLNLADRWQPHEIWFTSDAFADALLTLRERYRFDGILINIPGRDPNWLETVASIEKQAGGSEIITWKAGGRTLIPPDDNAQYEAAGQPPYPDFMAFDPETDFDRLDEWPQYTWGVYHTPYLSGKTPGLLTAVPEYFYHTIDQVRAAVGATISIHGEVFSPFTHFLELFGYQEAMLALVLDAGKAAAILDRLADAALVWGRAQAQRGVDAVLISSAFAGAGFISPQMYAQFVLPYERKVVDALHAEFPALPVYTHTCGKLGDRLELLAASHTDGVDTLDPPPLGDTELADAKARIGQQLFIKGNLNAVALLTDTRQQVIDRARSALASGKPGGGYILSTACSVAPRVEPWKLELLSDLAEEYGHWEE
ncbi:MAG TPA: uroporphyrinogen decarboxylase family protein [Phototrophicaceae bacterium]|nr:uroporphyrinogen decarboxylase family protein [Phototrophicaceae bacterium]